MFNRPARRRATTRGRLSSSFVLACGALALFNGCGKLSTVIARRDGPFDAGGTELGGGTNVDGFGGETGSGAPDETPAGGGPTQQEATGGSSTGGSSPAEVVARPVFETPFAVTPLNDPIAKDQDPSLPADQLEIMFFSDRSGSADLWHARRPSPSEDWGAPEPITELNDPVELEYNPTLSADGLRIWFCSSRDPAGIWYSDRPSRVEPFSAPIAVFVDPLAEENLVIAPSLMADFLAMAVSIGVGDTRDLYWVTRPDLISPWSTPVALSGINSDAADSTPHLYDDGLQILFASGRAGVGDLFWARRTQLDEPVTQVEALDELNEVEAFESYPHLTADQRFIYFGSSRSGGTDIYMARRKE